MSQVPQQQEVWTIKRLLEWTTQWFARQQVEGGRLAAELLLARALGCRKIELYTRYECVPSDDQRQAFRELVRQAGEHVPIAYLLGQREFFSLPFQVTPAVLIPRPETEALAQRAIALCRQSPDRTWHILDVGTGTGCVAAAIAKFATNTDVVASDLSSEALAVARLNIEQLGLADRVHLVEADLTAIPADLLPEGGFDVIVSNPPYISEQHFRNLPPHIRDHEPRLALVPPGEDGLSLYRRFATEAPAILKSDGRLLVEIGFDQLAEVKEIFATATWSFAGTHHDRTDPHERVAEFALQKR